MINHYTDRMEKYIIYLFTIVLASCSQPPEYDFVIENVELFNGEEDVGIVHIAINSDTIAAISTEVLLSDSTLDGSGKYVIPGMVNAHVHVSSLEDLQAGYPLGILTLLNMHTGLEEREHTWKQISRDSIGFSSLYGAGHAATAPGGHPNQFSQDMETISNSLPVEEWVDRRIAANVDYIKIVRDHNEWMENPALPTLSYEQIGHIIEYAQNKGFKAVVHATTIEEIVQIAEFKPDGFVHMPDYKDDYPVPESFYRTLAESGAFVVTTGGISLKPVDDTPPFVREWVTNNLFDANQRAEIIKKLHEYGVLIVAGTDAQAEQMNFDSDYFYELELYKMAGLSNSEILKTATGNAARAFNLPIGEIKIGSKANMILLTASPIDDIENLKKVEQVWKNGKKDSMSCTRSNSISENMKTNEQIYTLGVWHVKDGLQQEFITAWKELGEVFASLPDSPGKGILIQSTTESTLFYSFGPWNSLDAVEAMRNNPQAQQGVRKLMDLCSEATPGSYRVVAESP